MERRGIMDYDLHDHYYDIELWLLNAVEISMCGVESVVKICIIQDQILQPHSKKSHINM